MAPGRDFDFCHRLALACLSMDSWPGMNTRSRNHGVPRWLAAALLGTSSLALAGTTAFFYQGRLLDGTAPATGIYDFQFRLFAAETGGPDIAAPVVKEDVPVVNGLFNVAVDFGAAPFTGDNRWLEISVRPGNVTNAFTNLVPRVPVLPVPYAIHAANADLAAVASQVNWSNMVGVPPFLPGPGLLFGASNEFIVNFAGSGASNTVSRSDHQHLGQSWIAATNPGLRIQLTAATGTNFAFWGQTDSTSGRGVLGWADAATGTNIGVHGLSSSARGIGVLGEATNTTGIGVMARGSGSGGAALAIANGGIRVPGAGLGTTTPAFIHRVTTTNVIFGNQISVINHPLCNGDSNAILFVTQNLDPGDPTGTNTAANMGQVLVLYTGTNPNYRPYTNRWAILSITEMFITNFPNLSPAYNVLVIKP